MYWQGIPMKTVAKYICRSKRSCLRWLGRYLATGRPGAAPWIRGRHRRIPDHIGAALDELLKNDPDWYLDELCGWLQSNHQFKCDEYVLCQYLVQVLHIYRKKVLCPLT
jgi:transposase